MGGGALSNSSFASKSSMADSSSAIGLFGGVLCGVGICR